MTGLFLNKQNLNNQQMLLSAFLCSGLSTVRSWSLHDQVPTPGQVHPPPRTTGRRGQACRSPQQAGAPAGHPCVGPCSLASDCQPQQQAWFGQGKHLFLRRFPEMPHGQRVWLVSPRSLASQGHCPSQWRANSIGGQVS